MKPKKFVITIEITGTTEQDIYEDLQTLIQAEPDFRHLKQRVDELTIDTEDTDL